MKNITDFSGLDECPNSFDECLLVPILWDLMNAGFSFFFSTLSRLPGNFFLDTSVPSIYLPSSPLSFSKTPLFVFGKLTPL